MAVNRALMFRAGENGLICAAYEVGIERGDQDRDGRIRPIRSCTNLATATWNGTGLCAGCRTVLERAAISVAEHIKQEPE